jgi:hypothetical protein
MGWEYDESRPEGDRWVEVFKPGEDDSSEPRSMTSGDQDHTNPWRFMGQPADPPANL